MFLFILFNHVGGMEEISEDFLLNYSFVGGGRRFKVLAMSIQCGCPWFCVNLKHCKFSIQCMHGKMC